MRNEPIYYAALGLLLTALTPSAFGQSQFRVTFQHNDDITVVGSGSTVPINAERVGATTTGQVTISYAGGPGATVTDISQVGSANFRLTGVPSVPLEISGSSRITFGVEYTARTAAATAAEIRVTFQERPLTPETPPVTGVLSFLLAGRAPQLQAIYILETNGNATLLQNGETIPFPETVLGAASNAMVVVLNRGSAPARVSRITVTGDAFAPFGMPLLPGDLATGEEVQFTLRFAPRTAGVHTGTVRIELGDQTLDIRAQGTGVSSQLSYTILTDDGSIEVQPGQPGTLPDIPVGQTRNLGLQIQNNGAADGNLSAISLTGPGFELLEAPAVPLVLRPGSAVTVRFTVTPTTAGTIRGRFRAGNDVVDVVGTALGARLEYSYATNDSRITISDGGVVVYPPTQIGDRDGSRVSFTVRNTGTTAGTVTSIAIAEAQSGFRLENVPALPVRIAPESSVTFDIIFAPESPGLSSSTLRIDTVAFLLNGNAGTPPPLPEIQFTGRGSGVAQALEQIPIGVSLAAGYPLPLRGTLTLSFSSDTFVNDPAIQFSTGGRVVGFTLDRNSSRVRFENGADEIRVQTGSVAGTITITPSFVTESGDVEVNPSSVPTLTLTIPRAAPRLLGVQAISDATGATVSLAVTGVSTPRSLTQLTFEFDVAPSFASRVGTTRVVADVSQIADQWFAVEASRTSGSAFVITAPFSFPGSTVPFNQLIRSVSVTATNEVGSSNQVRVEVSAP